MQVGLSSSNDTVACASIRVAGAVLQAVLAGHHPCTQAESAAPDARTNCDSMPLQEQQLQVRQQQQQLDKHTLPGHSWLCDDSSLSLQQTSPVSTGITAGRTPSEDQHKLSGQTGHHALLPAAGALPTAPAGSAVAHGTSHKPVFDSAGDMDPADASGFLLKALVSVASGTSISSSCAPSNTVHGGASSASCSVDVRTAALLELSQLMLLLADGATQQDSNHHPAPQQPDSVSASCSQHMRTGEEQGLTSSAQTSSASSSYVLGLSWVQSVLQASMEALTKREPALRRWVMQGTLCQHLKGADATALRMQMTRHSAKLAGSHYTGTCMHACQTDVPCFAVSCLHLLPLVLTFNVFVMPCRAASQALAAALILQEGAASHRQHSPPQQLHQAALASTDT